MQHWSATPTGVRLQAAAFFSSEKKKKNKTVSLRFRAVLIFSLIISIGGRWGSRPAVVADASRKKKKFSVFY